jgi:hypothetical protein
LARKVPKEAIKYHCDGLYNLKLEAEKSRDFLDLRSGIIEKTTISAVETRTQLLLSTGALLGDTTYAHSGALIAHLLIFRALSHMTPSRNIY